MIKMTKKRKKIRRLLGFLVRTALLLLASCYVVLLGLSLFTQKAQDNIHSLSDDASPESEEFLPEPPPVPTPLQTIPPILPTPPPEPLFQETDGYIGVEVASIYDNPQLTGDPIRHVTIRSQVHLTGREGEAFAVEVTESSVPEYGTVGYVAIKDIVTDLDDVRYGQQEEERREEPPVSSNREELGFGADPIPLPEDSALPPA